MSTGGQVRRIYGTTYMNADDIATWAGLSNMSDEEVAEKILNLFVPTPSSKLEESLIDWLSKKTLAVVKTAYSWITNFVTVLQIGIVLKEKGFSDDFKEMAAQMDAYGGRGAMKVKIQLGEAFFDEYGRFETFVNSIKIVSYQYGPNY